MKNTIDGLTAIIPFLQPYPSWVKVLVAVWVMLSAILVLCLLLARPPQPDKQPTKSETTSDSSSPPVGTGDVKTQTAVNSPGATQIIADTFVLQVAPTLERKLTMEPLHINKPVGEKFESIFRGSLEAPYPIPSLRVEAHGKTVELVDLSPMRSGVVLTGHTGRRESYAFTTLQNAIGKLQLRVVTGKPEKLDIRFSAHE